MIENNNIEIELYGPLRQLMPSNPWKTPISLPIKAKDLKKMLASILITNNTETHLEELLVSESVVGIQNQILQDDEIIHQGSKIFILPPVNGG